MNTSVVFVFLFVLDCGLVSAYLHPLQCCSSAFSTRLFVVMKWTSLSVCEEIKRLANSVWIYYSGCAGDTTVCRTVIAEHSWLRYTSASVLWACRHSVINWHRLPRSFWCDVPRETNRTIKWITLLTETQIVTDRYTRRDKNGNNRWQRDKRIYNSGQR